MLGPVGCSKYLADCQATNTFLFWSGALASASSAASVRPKASNSQRPCSTKDPLCRVFVSGTVASKVRKTTITFYTTFKTDLAPTLNQLVMAHQWAGSIGYYSCHSGPSPAPSGISSLGVVGRGPAAFFPSPLLCLTDCICKNDSGE